MEEMVERIRRAVEQKDRKEVERIVHDLIVIGACDTERALNILTRR